MINLYTDADLVSGPLLKFNEELQYGTDADLAACIYNGKIFIAKDVKANIPVGPFDNTKFAPMSSGLRQIPVDTEEKLKQLTGIEYAEVLVKASGREYVFKPTAVLTPEEDADTNNIPDNANSGKWIYQVLKGLHKPAILETVMGDSNMKDHPDYMSMALGTATRNEGGFFSATRDDHSSIVFPRDGTFEITNTMVGIAPTTESGTGYKNQRFGLFLYRDGTEVREVGRIEIRMDDDGQSVYPTIFGTVDAKAGDYLRTLSIGSNGRQINYINRKLIIKQLTESVVEKDHTNNYPEPGIEYDTGEKIDGQTVYRQAYTAAARRDDDYYEIFPFKAKPLFYRGGYKVADTDAYRTVDYHSGGGIFSMGGKVYLSLDEDHKELYVVVDYIRL